MEEDRNSNSSDKPRGKSTPNNQERDVSRGSSEPKRRRGIQPRRNPSRSEFPQRTQSSPEKVETRVSDSAKKFEYSRQVTDDVTAVIGEQPYLAYKRVTPVISVSSLFDYLVESTFRYVELRTMRLEPLFTQEELSYTYRYILALRLAHVSGSKMPDGARPAEVRYPAILGPVLAAIGRYVHPTSALELVPTIDPRMDNWKGLVRMGEGPNEFSPTKDSLIHWTWDIQRPDVINRVLSTLLALGCPISIGLPVDTITETDELYRLDNSVDAKLVGSGDFAPSAGILLSRAFLELSTLADLYGEARVVYAALATLRSAVDKLARDSFTMEVGSNVPR